MNWIWFFQNTIWESIFLVLFHRTSSNKRSIDGNTVTHKRRKTSVNNSQDIIDSQEEYEENNEYIEMTPDVQIMDLEKQKKEDELKKFHESITSYM